MRPERWVRTSVQQWEVYGVLWKTRMRAESDRLVLGRLRSQKNTSLSWEGRFLGWRTS